MKNRLKIAYLDFDDIKNPLLGAGQAKATLEVGFRLGAKGHTVEVFCSKYPGSKDRVENGIKYTHIGLGSKFIRLNNLIYIIVLPLTVRKIEADVVVECFTAPVSTLFSPLFTKIPVVALPTSFEADRFSKLYHLPFQLVENLGLRFYKYFLPTSKYFEEKMRRVNPSVITKIVGQGVENKYFDIRRRKGKYILFLGRLDIGQKGIDLLVSSYAKISSKIPYPLVIAGHGPDEQKFKELVKKLHLSRKVKFIGPTFGKKKDKILSSALYVVIPSRHEGFGIFALEALAAGLPIVSFDIPGLSWVPTSVSLKAKPFDTEELANLMIKVSDKKINSKLSRKCKKVAKRYSWDDVVKQYEKFFWQMIKKDKTCFKTRLLGSS